jgi:uncharacterized lipoprotein NlpE involved in copper resistance
MPKKIEIKWKNGGLRKIRYGDADRRVISYLEKNVQKVADRANRMARANGWKNAHYATGSQPGRRNPQGRHRTSVVTANAEAMLDNAKSNTLTKALFSSD